ncbi:MAG: hypothetical protein ACRCXX_07755 [Cetobacterium sp.]|uniref:hypothetical protein n=1 Tax=Cetobacterium sp. TaxID=2071632 RepID=UPI003F39A95C
MGALSKKRSRSIDSLWRGNDALITAVEAAVGIPIGSDDGVLFIQDVGTKIVGRAYIDKNNGRMYRCITVTSSVSNDTNFEMIGIDKNSDSLQNLLEYRNIGSSLNTGVPGLLVFKRNGVVTVSYVGPHSGGASNIIYTLPVGFRPYAMQRVSIFPTSAHNTNMIIYNNGGIVIDCYTGGPTTVSGGYSFLVAD